MIKEILEILEKEIEVFGKLQYLLKDKQVAIVNFDYDSLQGILSKEMEILDKISELEDSRIELFSKLTGVEREKVEKMSLNEIISRLEVNADDKEKFEKFAGRLKDCISSVKKLNDVNRYLLSHSLKFTKGMLELFSGARKILNKKI